MSTNPEGNVLNFYCELPHSLDTVEKVGSALLELDLAVTSLSEPPIAGISSPFAVGNSVEVLESEMEDYRRFYVDFEPHATQDDVIKAVDVVYGALNRLRSQ